MGNAGPFQLCFSKVIAVAFDQRRLQMRNCPRVAPGIEMGGGRNRLGAGSKIRPRVRPECSSQTGEGKGGRGTDAEPCTLKQFIRCHLFNKKLYQNSEYLDWAEVGS